MTGETEPSIGEFTIVRELGRGGMGVVYLAEQESPRRAVALKVVRPGSAGDESQSRFRQEIDVLARLRHPAIAQIFSAGRADVGAGEQPYFVMEYVEGAPLLDFAESGALDVTGRVELLARICDGIHHAHDKGVVHRDLKPANILVQPDGTPKILDFGVARVVDPELRRSTLLHEAGRLIGTLQYMSPEQVGDDAEAVDRRSDVYALGVLGYELLSGRLPYALEGKSVHEVLRMIAEDDPAPLSAAAPALRGDLETIVGKALAKEPSFRYASAGDLAADLRRYLRREPVRARPPTTWYQVRRFASRNPRFAASLVALVIALVVGIVSSVHLRQKAIDARQLADERRLVTLSNSIETAAERGDWRSVLELVEGRARSAGLDTWEMRLWEVEALMSTSRRKQAHERLDGLLARDDAGPHRARLLLLKGDLAFDDSATALLGEEMLREALALGLDEVDAAYAEALLAPTMPALADGLDEVLRLRPTHLAARQRRVVAFFFLGRLDDAQREVHTLQTLFPEEPSAVVIDLVIRTIRGNDPPTGEEREVVRKQLGAEALAALETVAQAVRLADESFRAGTVIPKATLTRFLMSIVSAVSVSNGSADQTEVGLTIPRLPALRNGILRLVPFLKDVLVEDYAGAAERIEAILDVNPEGTLFLMHGIAVLAANGDHRIARASLLRSLELPAFIPSCERLALDYLIQVANEHRGATRPAFREHARRSGLDLVRRRWGLGVESADDYYPLVNVSAFLGDPDLTRVLCSEAIERFPDAASKYLQYRGIAHVQQGNYGSALLDFDAGLGSGAPVYGAEGLRALAARNLGKVGRPDHAVDGAKYLASVGAPTADEESDSNE